MKIEKYLNLFRQDAQELLSVNFPIELIDRGYDEAKFEFGEMYFYTPGEIPILLIAHVDTVHNELPQVILYDQGYAWSPQGLGADDRAGVAGILALIDMGFRPHILLTDGEERGGIGAQEAVKNMTIPDIRYMIELDRKGSVDAVFYNCDNTEFQDFVVDFGFSKAVGSFTDISKLCPGWGISGVNLSIGYYNAHTKSEYLVEDEFFATIYRVAEMLSRVPDETFKYIEKKQTQVKTTKSYATKNAYRKANFTVYKGGKSVVSSSEDYYGDLFDDNYYEKLYSSYYPKKSYSSFDYEEFLAMIMVEELAEMFGGSVESWSAWLRANRDQLETEFENLIFEYAEACAEGVILHDELSK